MKHGLVWYGGMFDRQYCEELIQRYSGNLQKGITVGEGDAPQEGRSSNVCFVYDEDVKLAVASLASRVNRDIYGFDIDTSFFEMQFTEYKGEENGKYDWHIDTYYDDDRYRMRMPVYDRKISISIPLSDPSTYQGGNFEAIGAESVDPNVLKQQGTAITFPSFLGHRVTEVTQGTRYSLVAWIEGPQFK